MTITAKVKEKYNQDKANFIIVKTADGYNVTNLRTFKMYKVSGNTCTCPDFKYRRSENNQGCKHIAAVKELEAAKKAEILKAIARW